jgi:hypothetical protein
VITKRVWTGILGFLLFGLLAAAPPREPTDPPLPTVMREIVAALQVLLPLSADDARFKDPAHRAEIDGALEWLARNSQYLEAHGSNRDAGFAYLGENLARDSQDIRKRFAEGRVAESRFLLQNLTDTCVACHSRLPDDKAHPLGLRLIENETIAALPAEERVHLEVATRQFKRALATYESLFADPAASMADLDLTGIFESYLEVCLRVQEDPERAISHLESLAARRDVSTRLRSHLKTWIASLYALRDEHHGPPIERARKLIQDHSGPLSMLNASELVPLVSASGVLYRYVASSSHPSGQLGEAYYLLGVIESRIGRSMWASQTEHLLETAIRMGPTEPYANQAFDLLEEFLVSGYTGSAGTRIPADVQQRLDNLHEMMVRAHPAKRP